MTEAEARAWILRTFGQDADTALARYAELLRAEAPRQNLISAATLDQIWSRHLADSAQLAVLAQDAPGLWVDVGSGAGLPGLVVAAVTERPVALVEPRRLRCEFLRKAATDLGAGDRIVVHATKAQHVAGSAPAAVISARAVASLPQLLSAACHLGDRKTLWIVPKGRSAAQEVASAREAWHGVFHVKRSLTDPEAGIVMASGVYRR